MLFTEFRFVAFFLIVFGVYWRLRANEPRKLWLLACSYFFYGCWNWKFLFLIGVQHDGGLLRRPRPGKLRRPLAPAAAGCS